MSWLEDRIIQHIYRNAEGDEIILELPAKEDAPPEYEGYKKAGFVPEKSNLTFKIQFERNGLVAYKYDTGNGKPRIVSATRENYERNIGNMSGDKLRQLKKEGRMSEIAKSVTTKGYQKKFEQVAAKRKKGPA